MKSFELTFLQQYDSDMPVIGSITCKILSCLAKTEHRAVYLVCFQGEPAKAVLKIDDCGRLKEEYRKLRHLESIPGLAVPHALACWMEGDRELMLREYIDGLTLTQWREEKELISAREIRMIGQSLCRLFSGMHRQKFIIRDIKPDNIIITKSGSLFLIDVDTMRLYSRAKDGDTLMVGTIGYAAPEQFGFCQSDERTDVYGLGQLLAWLATGEPNPERVKGAHLPWRLKHIIHKCSAFDPKRRYRGMEQVRKALRNLYAVPLAALITAALCVILGFVLRVNIPNGDVIDSSRYGSLQEAVDSVSPWTSGIISVTQDVELDSPLMINQRKITLRGNGVIQNAAGMEGYGVVVVANDGQLILEKGLTLRSYGGPNAVTCDGIFTLDGANLYTYASKGSMLFYNAGTFTIRSGELMISAANGEEGWTAINSGLLVMEGGLILGEKMSAGVLNSGEARYNGGAIKLYAPDPAVALCTHNHEAGYSANNGTLFMVNDRKIP